MNEEMTENLVFDIFICFYILYNVEKRTQNRHKITGSQKGSDEYNCVPRALNTTVRRGSGNCNSTWTLTFVSLCCAVVGLKMVVL